MRVIVISVALFVAFVIAAVGFMKSESTPQPAATATTAVVANPFADDLNKDKNKDEKVALPTLPQSPGLSKPGLSNPEQTNSEQSSNPQATTIDQATGLSSSASTNSDGGAASTGTVTNHSADVSSQQATYADQVQQDGEQDKPRKLGLAMLELEKEKKRNLIAVIVNQNNKQDLTVAQIKDMYQDRLTKWGDGSKVLLFNLPLGDKYREKFSQQILNMTALEADQAETLRRENHIKFNPVEVKASNIMVSYVEQHPNAVAYVPMSVIHSKSNVRVILTIP